MKAIGMVEYKTVSSGIKAADLIVKTAEVELLEAQTVCPGKFIILFTGDLSAIRVSVDAAVKTFQQVYYCMGMSRRIILSAEHDILE